MFDLTEIKSKYLKVNVFLFENCTNTAAQEDLADPALYNQD